MVRTPGIGVGNLLACCVCKREETVSLEIASAMHCLSQIIMCLTVTVKLFCAAMKNNFLRSVIRRGCFDAFPCHTSTVP